MLKEFCGHLIGHEATLARQCDTTLRNSYEPMCREVAKMDFVE